MSQPGRICGDQGGVTKTAQNRGGGVPLGASPLGWSAGLGLHIPFHPPGLNQHCSWSVAMGSTPARCCWLRVGKGGPLVLHSAAFCLFLAESLKCEAGRGHCHLPRKALKAGCQVVPETPTCTACLKHESTTYLYLCFQLGGGQSQGVCEKTFGLTEAQSSTKLGYVHGLLCSGHARFHLGWCWDCITPTSTACRQGHMNWGVRLWWGHLGGGLGQQIAALVVVHSMNHHVYSPPSVSILL